MRLEECNWLILLMTTRTCASGKGVLNVAATFFGIAPPVERGTGEPLDVGVRRGGRGGTTKIPSLLIVFAGTFR